MRGMAGLGVALLLLCSCATPERDLVEGNRAYLRGDSATARAAYQRAANFPETRASARLNLGRLLLEAGDATNAKVYLDQGLSERPGFALGRVHRAQAELALGQPAEAEVELLKAVELDPALAPAWLALARLQAAQSRFSQAVASLQKVRRMPAHQAEATFLGLEYRRQEGSVDASLAELRDLIATHPYLARTYFELGALMLERNDPSEAARLLGRGLELQPGDLLSRFRLGQSLVASGRPEQAIIEFQRVETGAVAQDAALAGQAKEQLQKLSSPSPAAVP